jgi:SAM-dependent methyltransferase
MSFYDAAFFRYVDAGAAASAAVVLDNVQRALKPQSVLDVGCGPGGWLATWRKLGVTDVIGLDGHYVDRARLAIPVELFQPRDLQYAFDLGRRFDLVQSLEVAEHLPRDRSETFVRSLVQHADRVLFSAAPPGQGGHGHVNERHYEFWRGLFRQHNYVAVDCLRPLILGDLRVEPWYRYNPVLYVAEQKLGELPDSVRAAVVPAGETIRDVAPMKYRVRKALVQCMPVWMMTAVARVKERVYRPSAPTN